MYYLKMEEKIETTNVTTAELTTDKKVKATITRTDLMTLEQAKKTLNELKAQLTFVEEELPRLEKEIDAIKEGWLPHLKKLKEDLDKIEKLKNADNLKALLKEKQERILRLKEAIAVFEKVVG